MTERPTEEQVAAELRRMAAADPGCSVTGAHAQIGLRHRAIQAFPVGWTGGAWRIWPLGERAVVFDVSGELPVAVLAEDAAREHDRAGRYVVSESRAWALSVARARNAARDARREEARALDAYALAEARLARAHDVRELTFRRLARALGGALQAGVVEPEDLGP